MEKYNITKAEESRMNTLNRKIKVQIREAKNHS